MDILNTKKSKIQKYSFFSIILLTILAIDQLTKWLASIFLIKNSVTIVPHILFLSYAKNTGAAWSIFPNNSTLLGYVGILIIILIYTSRKHLEIAKQKNQIIYGLICAGIIGNIIDRLCFGNVIDFIDVRILSFQWPIFNIADAAICIGILLYFLFTFRTKTK